MNTSRTPTNGNNSVRRWFRRGHRWVGLSLVVFVVFLAISGIALNHSGDLDLGGRHVSWSWLLDAYGLEVPAASASYADAGHRATLLGGHLFLDGRDTGQKDSTLVGIASLGPLVLIGSSKSAYLFTAEGEFVEAIDLGSESVGEIDRVGRTGDRAVVGGAGGLYISDQDIVQFEPQTDMTVEHWSEASSPGAGEIAVLEAAWRGNGLTVERVLLDLHSGRILGKVGPLLMDLVAVFLIVLSLSGLILAKVRNRKK